MKITIFLSLLLLCLCGSILLSYKEKKPVIKDDQREFKTYLQPISDVDPYFVESEYITSANGPSSITRNIIEDRQGQIWLASWEGIIGYDGELFSQYTSNFVGYIYEDSKDQIWTSTPGGEGENWILTSYSRLLPGDIIKSSKVLHPKIGMLFGINEDNQGHLRVGGI